MARRAVRVGLAAILTAACLTPAVCSAFGQDKTPAEPPSADTLDGIVVDESGKPIPDEE